MVEDKSHRENRTLEINQIGCGELTRTLTYLDNLIEHRYTVCWNESEADILIKARDLLSRWKEASDNE